MPEWLDRMALARADGNIDSLRTLYSPSYGDRIPHLEANDQIVARAIAAEVHLLMAERDSAASVLSPYLSFSDESPRRPLRAVADAIETTGAHRRDIAQIYMQVGNTFYRFHDHERAEEYLQSARGYYQTALARARSNRRTVEIERWLNEVWIGRLAMRRSGRWRDAEAQLVTAIGALDQLYEAFSSRSEGDGIEELDPDGGRLDLVLAIGLNIYSQLCWKMGNFDDARRLVYRSLFLLRDGRARDEIREAHTLHSASRIEGSQSQERFAWGAHLASRAATRFKRSSHPFLARSLVQRAACLAKSDGALESPDKIGVRANAVLRHVNIDELPDKDEQTFVQGDVDLVRLWISEKRAAANMEDWNECHEMALSLHERKLPNRLEGEALFHLGRCLARLGSDVKVAEGRDLLQRAEHHARDEGRVKIQAACNAALAESYLGSDMAEAKRYYGRAERLAIEAPSAYVTEWLEHLSVQVRGMAQIDVKGDKSQFTKRARRLYASYHGAEIEASGGHLKDEIERRTGLAPSTFYNWLGKKPPRE